MLYVLVVPHVQKYAQGSGVLAGMAQRVRGFTEASAEEVGVELGNVHRPHSGSELAMYSGRAFGLPAGRKPSAGSRSKKVALHTNPMA